MTVKELIDFLSKENPDMEVVVNGYEDGFDTINSIHHKMVKPYSDPRWYYGKYEQSNTSGKVVLLLSRH